MSGHTVVALCGVIENASVLGTRGSIAVCGGLAGSKRVKDEIRLSLPRIGLLKNEGHNACEGGCGRRSAAHDLRFDELALAVGQTNSVLAKQVAIVLTGCVQRDIGQIALAIVGYAGSGLPGGLVIELARSAAGCKQREKAALRGVGAALIPGCFRDIAKR